MYDQSYLLWAINMTRANASRVTTLASHYGQIADNVMCNEMTAIKAEIEQEFDKNSRVGSRSFVWYPYSTATKQKEEIIKWLQDEGCAVVWNYDQKDGNWVEIAY